MPITREQAEEIHELCDLAYVNSDEDMQVNLEKIKYIIEIAYPELDANQ